MTAQRQEAPASLRGTITLISGCMFSGKTTELLQRLDQAASRGTLAVKHASDIRFAEDMILTHGGKSRPAVIVQRASDILRRAQRGIDIVGIDEAHFFDAELPLVVARLANAGISSVLTSLDPDSWGRPFPINWALAELSDNVVCKFATCARCRAPANRTQRLTPIINGQMIVDPSNYEPRCEICWRPPPIS